MEFSEWVLLLCSLTWDVSHHALVSLTLQGNETKCLDHIFCTAFLYSLSPHFFFLIEGGLLSNIGLISAIYQYELANRCTYVPSLLNLPPASHPSHPSRLSQSTWCELSASYTKFPLALFYVQSCICFRAALSIRPSSPTVSTILFSICVSTAGLQTGSSVPSTVLFVLRMHIPLGVCSQMLIAYLCVVLLPKWIHS